MVIYCNAKSKRTGFKCKARAMKGKDKCYHHGAKTPFKTDGSQSKYRDTLPTLVQQRRKIDANPRLISSDELLKKYTTLINQLYDDLSLSLDEPCLLCGAFGGNLVEHPALKPLLENLASATSKAAAVEELKMKKGYYKSLAEWTDWLTKTLIPMLEDLLKPGKMQVLQQRLLQIEDKT